MTALIPSAAVSTAWQRMAHLSSGEIGVVCPHPAHMGPTKLWGSLGEGKLCTPASVHVHTCAPESLFLEKVPLSWKLLRLLLHTKVFSFSDTSSAQHSRYVCGMS